MNLKEEINRIRNIIIEDDNRKKYIKTTDNLRNSIHMYLVKLFSKGERTIRKKSRNYGNLGETWCIDGMEQVIVQYYYVNNLFSRGTLSISGELVSFIQRFFSVRRAYVIYIIEEWYDEIMVPKFEEIIGERGLSIDEINVRNADEIIKCIPEPIKPEGITDEEMIDFIVKNTLYTKDDVRVKIESGERDLEDFYLQIVDIANRR